VRPLGLWPPPSSRAGANSRPGPVRRPSSLFEKDPSVDVDREVTARLEREHYDPEACSGHQRSGR
jgi:hypothetical protein